MANPPPTGIVTFLFTDIEGSTKLWERYPDRMPEVLERHNEILRSAVENHDGYVFKTVGDAFCATFSHPREALRAALEVQHALFAERWGKPIRSLRVRMALHTGYAELERDGDYFGPAVNRVARLTSLAYGGQVLLSGTTHDQVRDHPKLVSEQAQLVELGEHYLKDLLRPERVSQLAVPGLLEKFSPPLREEAPEEEERYRIKSFLGSGSFAKVYLAHDEELAQDVALKVLHPWHADDEEFVERFKREAKNAAKLRSHPNVVPVYDRGEKEDGTYFMVMEYLPGGTLEDLIERERILPVRKALEITLQITRALLEAHEQGVIHRDIKPENVLMTKRGDAKVGDFGIAKAAEGATRLTRTGFNPGTVHYMSPEQVRGEEATSKSDLYALGVVLYRMLAGKLPFEGNTSSEIQNKHLRERVHPLKEMNPYMPEQVETVTLRLLAKDPNERYPNASSLIEELEQALLSLEEDEDTRPGKTSLSSTVEVPDIAGQDIFLANEALASRGLKLGDQKEASSEAITEGEIMGQAPAAGTKVERDSDVSITVSLGPREEATPVLNVPPPPTTEGVPDLGRPRSELYKRPSPPRTTARETVRPSPEAREGGERRRRRRPGIVILLLLLLAVLGATVYAFFPRTSPQETSASPPAAVQKVEKTPSQVEEPPAQQAGGADAGNVVVRVSGTEGIAYTGSYGTRGGTNRGEAQFVSEAEVKAEPTDYQVEIQDASDLPVDVRFRKDQQDGTLRVEIVADGEVVAEDETTEDLGDVDSIWPPLGPTPT